MLATYPSANATHKSPTGEIVAMFSRPMDATTVTPQSFAVSVNGTAVANSPMPQPVSISGFVTDTRVFRWRLTSANGTPTPLGTSAAVHVDFSPAGNVIHDNGGAALAAAHLDYTTLPFSAPAGAEFTSDPVDAIGIDSISGPATLTVMVDFTDAASGDKLELYLFGKEPGVAQNPHTIALFRRINCLIGYPLDSSAWRAASNASCETRSIRRASFAPNSATGSKPLTSPAIRTISRDGSKRVMGPIPL